jgi:hypothetical protein
MIAIVGAEYDGSTHLAADAVLARRLQDHLLTDGKYIPSKVAGHRKTRPRCVGA